MKALRKIAEPFLRTAGAEGYSGEATLNLATRLRRRLPSNPGPPPQLEIFLKTSPRNFRSRIVGNDCANQSFHAAPPLPDNDDLAAVQPFSFVKTN
jgi:hypothetical protein